MTGTGRRWGRGRKSVASALVALVGAGVLLAAGMGRGGAGSLDDSPVPELVAAVTTPTPPDAMLGPTPAATAGGATPAPAPTPSGVAASATPTPGSAVPTIGLDLAATVECSSSGDPVASVRLTASNPGPGVAPAQRVVVAVDPSSGVVLASAAGGAGSTELLLDVPAMEAATSHSQIVTASGPRGVVTIFARPKIGPGPGASVTVVFPAVVAAALEVTVGPDQRSTLDPTTGALTPAVEPLTVTVRHRADGGCAALTGGQVHLSLARDGAVLDGSAFGGARASVGMLADGVWTIPPGVETATLVLPLVPDREGVYVLTATGPDNSDRARVSVEVEGVPPRATATLDARVGQCRSAGLERARYVTLTLTNGEGVASDVGFAVSLVGQARLELGGEPFPGTWKAPALDPYADARLQLRVVGDGLVTLHVEQTEGAVVVRPDPLERRIDLSDEHDDPTLRWLDDEPVVVARSQIVPGDLSSFAVTLEARNRSCLPVDVSIRAIPDVDLVSTRSDFDAGMWSGVGPGVSRLELGFATRPAAGTYQIVAGSGSARATMEVTVEDGEPPEPAEVVIDMVADEISPCDRETVVRLVATNVGGSASATTRVEVIADPGADLTATAPGFVSDPDKRNAGTWTVPGLAPGGTHTLPVLVAAGRTDIGLAMRAPGTADAIVLPFGQASADVGFGPLVFEPGAFEATGHELDTVAGRVAGEVISRGTEDTTVDVYLIPGTVPPPRLDDDSTPPPTPAVSFGDEGPLTGSLAVDEHLRIAPLVHLLTPATEESVTLVVLPRGADCDLADNVAVVPLAFLDVGLSLTVDPASDGPGPKPIVHGRDHTAVATVTSSGAPVDDVFVELSSDGVDLSGEPSATLALSAGPATHTVDIDTSPAAASYRGAITAEASAGAFEPAANRADNRATIDVEVIPDVNLRIREVPLQSDGPSKVWTAEELVVNVELASLGPSPALGTVALGRLVGLGVGATASLRPSDADGGLSGGDDDALAFDFIDRGVVHAETLTVHLRGMTEGGSIELTATAQDGSQATHTIDVPAPPRDAFLVETSELSRWSDRLARASCELEEGSPPEAVYVLVLCNRGPHDIGIVADVTATRRRFSTGRLDSRCVSASGEGDVMSCAATIGGRSAAVLGLPVTDWPASIAGGGLTVTVAGSPVDLGSDEEVLARGAGGAGDTVTSVLEWWPALLAGAVLLGWLLLPPGTRRRRRSTAGRRDG